MRRGDPDAQRSPGGASAGFRVRPPGQDFSAAAPFGYDPPPWVKPPTIAVICHLFHVETAREIRGYLDHIPFAADLFVSTDTLEKAGDLTSCFGDWDRGEVAVRVTPNRGRDIAAKLVGFSDVYDRFDYVLHLHSKRSEHTGDLSAWRRFLLESLVGSSASVRSVFEAFARDPGLGMIFPQHFEPVRPWVSWGPNYELARGLAERMGARVSPGQVIDFPTGSMFWARSAALRPLLALGLSFDDFPPETGQVDGTLAHAIERLYLIACESAGFRWMKIAHPRLYADTATIMPIDSPAALQQFITDHGVTISKPGQTTVCIATYKRPDGLERLLRSLAEQTGAPAFDVVVVDNDAKGSAGAVAERFAGILDIAYLIEPERGLAKVRNRAVAAAAGTFVAFIDDDEWADPRWLAELHAKATETRADVVIGPVQVVFEDTVAAAVRTCGLFDLMPIADGEPVPWWFTRTSNAYVRRATLQSQEGPFCRDFDLSGGEDIELFWRIIEAGGRVVAAARARVFEYRAARRASLGWVLRRAARDGHNKALLEWRRHPPEALRSLGLGSAGDALREAFAAVGAWPRSRERALKSALRCAGEVGKLAYLAGIRIDEYRHHS